MPVAAIVSIRDLERLEEYDRERAEQFEVFHRIGEPFTDLWLEEIEEGFAAAITNVPARSQPSGDES